VVLRNGRRKDLRDRKKTGDKKRDIFCVHYDTRKAKTGGGLYRNKVGRGCEGTGVGTILLNKKTPSCVGPGL